MVKIYLDPGHGGSDPGASSYGIKEKDITLKLAKKTQSYLNDYKNVTVKMSRTKDTYPSLTKRTNEANSWGADAFVSIHINSGGGHGYEDFIYNGNVSAKTRTLQNEIHKQVSKEFKTNRGKKRANLHVCRESRMPAVLTENGFVDNKADSNNMKDNAFLDRVAKAHAVGIANAFGLKKKSGSGSTGGSSGGGGGSKSTNKLLEIKAKELWTYNTANWEDKAVIVKKGEVFTIKKNKFKVGNGHMYQIKSGLYITANEKYVRPYGKSSSKPKPKPKTYKVGDKATVKKNAKKFATGESIASFVKGSSYTIKQVKSDRVLLSGIMSWVKKTDLK